jgi:hypothetical protein
MAKNPNANITISFTSVVVGEDGDDPAATIELEVNELDQADGDTTFLFGDTAIYRVFKGSKIDSITAVVSAGTEASVSVNNTAEIVDEVITFINTNTANTKYPIDSGFSATLMGGVGVGAISTTSGSSLLTGSASISEENPIIGVYLVTYTTKFDKRSLSSVAMPDGWPDGEAYPVMVFVVCTVKDT